MLLLLMAGNYSMDLVDFFFGRTCIQFGGFNAQTLQGSKLILHE